MAEGDKYWHFPSHDIPGSARPARKQGAGEWAWEEPPGARAVAGSKLSVLYCKDATKQQPFYASTKCLLAERDAASEGIALFNDIPLAGSRQQLQPPDQVQPPPRFRNRFSVCVHKRAGAIVRLEPAPPHPFGDPRGPTHRLAAAAFERSTHIERFGLERFRVSFELQV
jgi:hypothetical protein